MLHTQTYKYRETSYILSRNKAINIKRRSKCGRAKGTQIERIECRTLKNDYFAWTRERRKRKLSERRKIEHDYYSRNMSETHSVSESESRHTAFLLILLLKLFFLRLCIINVSYASFASFFCSHPLLLLLLLLLLLPLLSLYFFMTCLDGCRCGYLLLYTFIN